MDLAGEEVRSIGAEEEEEETTLFVGGEEKDRSIVTLFATACSSSTGLRESISNNERCYNIINI